MPKLNNEIIQIFNDWMAHSRTYLLDILPYNTTLGNFNIKWAVAILLVLAVWVVYELYLQPKQRQSTRMARGPQQSMPPQEQFSSIAPPSYPLPQQSFPVFGSQPPQQRRKPNIFFAPSQSSARRVPWDRHRK